MPTVLRAAGFNVVIWTHDHEPMHVHVYQGAPSSAPEVQIYLGDISVKDINGMRAKDIRRVQEIVAKHREFLIGEWNRIQPIP